MGVAGEAVSQRDSPEDLAGGIQQLNVDDALLLLAEGQGGRGHVELQVTGHEGGR